MAYASLLLAQRKIIPLEYRGLRTPPTCRFAVSAEGFAQLDAYLANSSDNPQDSRLAMEPTGGAYPRTAAHHLEQRGFTIAYIANDHIKHYRQLYARAGDIARFRNERQFQKYVGFSPVRYESGSSIKGAHLSHVGDRACRKALFMAALVIQSDSVPRTAFRVLAERLRATGKHGWNINCHVAGALARAVYHTLKRGEPYDVERHLRAAEYSE